MESDSWSRFSAAAVLSKRLQTSAGGVHQSRHNGDHSSSRDVSIRALRDLLMGIDECEDGEEEDASRAEFACPFCYEDFDVIGLCCHVEDEHPVEARNGVCPVCASRVGPDLVGHITTQHSNFYKIQRRRRFRRGSSATQAMLSLLKRDLKEGNLQTLLRDSSFTAPANSGASDPFLSSFIYTIPGDESAKESEQEALGEIILTNKPTDETVAPTRAEPSLTVKDLKERAIRGKFVQNLLLSTMFGDVL